MYPWMPAYMGNNNQILNLASQLNNNNQMLNLTNQLNYYQQKLNEQIQNSTNSINCCCSSSPNVEKTFFHGKEVTEDFLNQQEKEIENLKAQLNDIIEQEDEKQKILKITSPSVLNKNIKADVVIVYGQISGEINANNVICIKGNITGNINADKVICPPRSQDAQTDFRIAHPDCRYCKFCGVKKPPSWSSCSDRYKCKVKDKELKRWYKIRARFCKYYQAKQGEE